MVTGRPKAIPQVVAPATMRGYDRLRFNTSRRLQKIIDKKWTDRLMFLPDFAVFLSRLMVDPRTTAGRRLLAGSALGYLVLPTDIIADVIPGVGWIDDVAFLALTVRELLAKTDPEVVHELWPNKDTAIIDAVTQTLDQVSELLPKRFWKRWERRRLF